MSVTALLAAGKESIGEVSSNPLPLFPPLRPFIKFVERETIF